MIIYWLQVLGVPSEDSWPGLSLLPNYRPGDLSSAPSTFNHYLFYFISLFFIVVRIKLMYFNLFHLKLFYLTNYEVHFKFVG